MSRKERIGYAIEEVGTVRELKSSQTLDTLKLHEAQKGDAPVNHRTNLVLVECLRVSELYLCCCFSSACILILQALGASNVFLSL